MTDISLETPEGSIDAVLEVPSGEGPWPGVVVIHDAFGLRKPHREIARRIADNGYLAVVPNMFARGGMIRCMRTMFSDLMAYEGRSFTTSRRPESYWRHVLIAAVQSASPDSA